VSDVMWRRRFCFGYEKCNSRQNMLQLWLVTRYQLLLLTDTLTAKMMCYIKLSSAL